MRIAIINYHPAVHVGGAEIQCDLIARELVEQGHQPLYLAVDLPTDVDPYARFRDLPYPVARFDSPANLTSLLRAHFIDAVYWRCGRAMLLRTAWAAQRAGASVVYAISGWSNVKPTWYRNVARKPGFRSRLDSVWQPIKGRVKSRMNWEGFRFVDGVVSNTRYILDAFPQGPGLPEPRRVIYNIAPDPSNRSSFQWPRPYLAWVANLHRIKNPDTVVDLARALPQTDILMVGRIKEPAFAYFEDPSRLPPNLHYLGPMPPAAVSGLLAQARCLVHTCSPEGFSGNLIQAWRQGCPTVVLHHDPDGIILRSGAGEYSETMERLVRACRNVMADDALRAQWSKAALRLVDEEFDRTRNVANLVSFIEEIGTRRS